MPVLIYSADAQSGDRGRVFLEGIEITDRCRAVQVFDDGTIIALCYRMLNGKFIVAPGGDDIATEELRGEGCVVTLPSEL